MLPLRLEPADANSPAKTAAAAVAWAAERKAWIRGQLVAHGALLFRGFALRTPEEFERFTLALSSDLSAYTRGVTPRTRIVGNVYSSTEMPPRCVVSLHSELSYVSRYPRRVFLFCHTPPQRGGETPIADVRRVLARIPREVRQRFEEKGVRYLQRVPAVRRKQWKSWQEMFETCDRGEVAAICRELAVDVGWAPDGALRLSNTRPALAVHPETGETVWFNQAHMFHHSWSREAWRSGERALAALARLEELVNHALRDARDFPGHSRYGDGTEIALADLARVREAHWREAVPIVWQRGDVLLLDNLLVAHGRMPYRGHRRILAALARD